MAQTSIPPSPPFKGGTTIAPLKRGWGIGGCVSPKRLANATFAIHYTLESLSNRLLFSAVEQLKNAVCLSINFGCVCHTPLCRNPA